MTGHGVAGDVQIDWPDLIRFKRSFTDPVPEKHERRYEEGIVTLHGTAKFTGPDRLSVGEEEIEYRKILIASEKPIPLDIPGEEHLIDNEGFLELPSLPKRIVLVGVDISLPFSHIAARAGAGSDPPARTANVDAVRTRTGELAHGCVRSDRCSRDHRNDCRLNSSTGRSVCGPRER